ncbi:MAG: hypothetical protein ACLR43_09220 [Faecalibacillus faecis]
MDEIEIAINSNKSLSQFLKLKYCNEIDENSIEVYDESKNVFNPISINDYATFAKKQKEMVAEEAIRKWFIK